MRIIVYKYFPDIRSSKLGMRFITSAYYTRIITELILSMWLSGEFLGTPPLYKQMLDVMHTNTEIHPVPSDSAKSVFERIFNQLIIVCKVNGLLTVKQTAD